MIKIKEMKADCFYVVKGRSAANSVFFETLVETRSFIEIANTRFAGFLEVHDYLLNEEGWTMLCKIKSEEEVKESYLKTIAKSRRPDRENYLEETWRILSEQFRHFISGFVKMTNKSQGRIGVKVRSTYERYYFESFEEAEDYIEQMRVQISDGFQKKEKYRGALGLYEKLYKKGKGREEMCTVREARYVEMIEGFLSGAFVRTIENKKHVLRTWINSTFFLHDEQLSKFKNSIVRLKV